MPSSQTLSKSVTTSDIRDDSPGGPIPIRISRFPFLANSRTSDVRTSSDNHIAENGVSLRSMLDNENGTEIPRPGGRSGGSSLVRDPVQEGLLSPEQGRALFNL